MQQQDLGLPFLGDGSQRPPSYCSSRSSSGDGGGAGGFLAGRAGEGGGADAADARACAAPPSSAAVNRYGQLLMGSAGWRCTAVYGMDLHDMLLLDRLTPRRTSAAQATPPLTAQQQRNPRTSTPEQSPASCASARPATSNVAPADAAAPVMAAAMEAPAPGGPHTAAGRQPASLAAIALRPGR
ncbi:hypothetical protein HXX76_006693 [Chlamydomonas incerta]|uniref:Uncharacterized protein n=1 Tax=Chlamydomonas incerta TaxID=51695 RepID=A0A835TDT0_CHLIN|nr:hypothetical protein HXX76_006693 [Chlamydomonas incerta]|eukprot:KAG2436386.1 hypothetical protein HXX76_006693 [Chlamydomonas incerta]